MIQFPDPTEFLNRDEFRQLCLLRDKNTCVVPGCGETANLSVHHIFERRLFKETEGYAMANGASVCEFHHLECERTNISVEEIREYAGITDILLPPGFDPSKVWDKWGNQILSNGMLLNGPLVSDASVGRILAEGRNAHRKYPRTQVLPYSKKNEDDDLQLEDDSIFNGVSVVITEKLDGENTTMYRDGIHARSLDSGHHESRTLVKRIWAEKVAYQIPEDMRIVGENMQARHTFDYSNVPAFLVFNIFVHNTCMRFSEMIEWCQLLGLSHVPVLYVGETNKDVLREFCHTRPSSYRDGPAEGLVVRNSDSFEVRHWNKNVAKWVDPSFVIGPERHWRYRIHVPNKVII